MLRYLLLFPLLISTSLLAQKPQPILGIAKEDKSISYYENQSALWQMEIEKRKDNGTAWINYYKAERAIAQLKSPGLWTEDVNTIFKNLQPIIEGCKSNMGSSYEYHYLSGMNTTGASSITAFEKAYAIDSERPEVHGWLFGEYVLSGQEEKSKNLGPKIIENNVYSNANLMWNYNALISAEPNSIFITNGDMDCLPKWALQYGSNIRTDVLVISKWMLVAKPDYLQSVLTHVRAEKPKKHFDDFGTSAEFMDYLTAYVIQNSQRKVYISSGTDINFLRSHNLEKDMYVVGAALHYSKNSFDNIAVMSANFENKYNLEYLLTNFQSHAQDKMVKEQMNLTYLPALFSLKTFYTQNKDQDHLNYCNVLIDRIAEESGRKETVLSWFN